MVAASSSFLRWLLEIEDPDRAVEIQRFRIKQDAIDYVLRHATLYGAKAKYKITRLEKDCEQ